MEHTTKRRASSRRPTDPDGAGKARPAAEEVGNRLRSLRRQRQLTLDELADAAGLDKSFLSRIERGEKAPSITTLMRLAEALDVQVAHLFGEKTEPGAIAVIRKSERKPVIARSVAGNHRYEALIPGGRHQVEAFVVYPGDADRATGSHPGDEMIYVLAGRVEVSFSDRTVELAKDDCLHFEGHLAHRIKRLGNEPACLLVVIARAKSG